MRNKHKLQQLSDQLLAYPSLPYYSSHKHQRLQDLLEGITDSQLVDRRSRIHLSASALVFFSQELLVVHHPYLNRWLLPAGHVEEGEDAWQTALRELHEETGYQILGCPDMPIVDINFFDIPANPSKNEGPHLHIDCRYWVRNPLQPSFAAELAHTTLKQDQAAKEFQPYFDLIHT